MNFLYVLTHRNRVIDNFNWRGQEDSKQFESRGNRENKFLPIAEKLLNNRTENYRLLKFKSFYVSS